MRTGVLQWIATLCLATAAALTFSQPTHAADIVAVLYPEVPEPERGLFDLIRKGARKSIDAEGASSMELAVGEAESKVDLAKRVQDAGATRVLMLGRRAYEIGAGLERQYPAYVAAVDLPVGRSSRIAGITMYADPAFVFKTLHLVAPRIERVIIIFDQKSTGWMVDAAKKAAQEERLDPVIYEARTLAEGADRAMKAVEYGNPDTDALWVLNGSGYATEDVLPNLVAESWRRRLLVFSNVVQHVTQGALFAVYVDPTALGKRAGIDVLHVARGAHDVVFLQDGDRAVNARVAAHLQLPVDGALAASFNLVLGR